MTHPRSARSSTLRLEGLEDRAVPATFNVNTTLDVLDPADGKRSLREAITAANTLSGADVIVLPAGGFKISLAAAGEDANLTGDFDISDTLTIQGAGKGKTFIEGQQLDRVIDILGSSPSSIRVVLQGLTVRNGSVTGNGGGIRVGNADLVVRDCLVAGNRASETGGGISNENARGTGNATLVRTSVDRNAAGNGGGGVWLMADGPGSALAVRDSTIRRNSAATIGGGGIEAATATLTNSIVSGNISGFVGGGIEAGTLNLTNCVVSGNFAPNLGGGIWASDATLTNSTVSGNSSDSDGGGINVATATLTNCTISGNSANGGGGISAGISVNLTNSTVSGNTASTLGGGIRTAGTATLTRSTVSGNAAGTNGGGILVGTANLTNSTVSGNTAGSNGGGIWATTATLLNCTIVENIALTGGGLFHNPGGTFNVRNTIVALNLVEFGGTGPDLSGNFASQGHNLIGSGPGGTGFTNGVNGDLVGTAANPIDPKLGPLANNGGRTRTHALLAESRAIDAGDNSILPPTDQRGGGFPRKKDGNGDGAATVDIGAYER
jgi:CSLREA domain-containing protein